MQSAVSQKAFVGQAVAAAPAKARAPRAAMVVRASAEDSRRAVLGGLIAGVAALTATSANAAIDLIDDRDARKKGYDIIYEARDLDLDQRIRDGQAQARSNLEFTRARLAESERRIDTKLDALVEKKYWTEAREELRRQVGTLSFDINVLAEQLPKDARKEAQAAKKALITEVGALDFAIRKKDQATAVEKLAATKSALDSVIAKLG